MMKHEELLNMAESLDLKSVKENGKRKSSKILHYEILDEDLDNDLIVLTKTMINNSHITYEDVYNIHDKNIGNNMIQSLKKNQLSWKRFMMWAEVCGYVPEIILKPKEE